MLTGWDFAFAPVERSFLPPVNFKGLPVGRSVVHLGLAIQRCGWFRELPADLSRATK